MPEMLPCPKVPLKAKLLEGFRLGLKRNGQRVTCAFLLLICALNGLTSLAVDKSGVGLSKISLPSGPGSIEGLGASFEPRLNSGTSAYSVKIASPPGVGGLQPDLVLHYNAGAGNGAFGLGWSDGLMCIQRRTEKGLPTYGESDEFTFQGEELVPLSDGSYRVKNESGFMRFTRVEDGWEVRDKSGRRHLLGTTKSSRVHRPNGDTFADTFKWCLDTVIDVHSNRMEYRYAEFQDSSGQIYCEEIRYSIGRTNQAIFHSIELVYELRPDPFMSFLSGFEVRTARRCREILVKSLGSLVRRYQLGYSLPADDPVEHIAPADAGVNFSLLRQVTQFDKGASANYLPPLRLGYTRFDLAEGTMGRVQNNPPYSLGDANTAFIDLNCDSLPDLLRTDPLSGRHEVSYNLGRGNFAPSVTLRNAPTGVTLATSGTELADYDGDGRVDLVQKLAGNSNRFVYYPNTTPSRDADDSRPEWGDEHSFIGASPHFALGDPSVRTLDVNGDKRMDLFRTTPFGFIYYINRGTWWEEDGLHLFGEPAMGNIDYGDNLVFSREELNGAQVPNPVVKLADMNGDRLMDLVRVTLSGTLLEVSFWPNKGNGAWGNRIEMSGTIELGVTPIEDVFIQDVNGDGVSDVVAVNYDRVLVWINQGTLGFSEEFILGNTPAFIKGETVLRQADINGNGSTDIIWENSDLKTGSYRIDYLDFLGREKPNLLKVIDNGIGLRTEMEYRTTTDFAIEAKASGNQWRTRLPFPSWCVSRITKTIGLDLDAVPGPDTYITDFSYHDGYYDTFEKEFRGFSFAKEIERGDDQFQNTPNEVEVNSPSTITRFYFHTGVPDGIDNNGDGSVDEFNDKGGYEEEPLKGKPLWQEITLPTADFGGSYPAQTDGYPADDAVVFTREYQDWRIKTIHTPANGFTYVDFQGVEQPENSIHATTLDGKSVSYAFLASNTKEIHETNGTLAGKPFPGGGKSGALVIPIRAKKVTRTETEVDCFGNSLISRSFGENSPDSAYDDERFTYATYAFNFDSWIIGMPARQIVTDESGHFVGESRSYYDGQPFVGLGLGKLGAFGDKTREERFINGSKLPPAFETISKEVGDPRLPVNASISTTRTQFDAFGNVIRVLDPLYKKPGDGHDREYGYDDTFNTYVATETIHVGNGSEDLVVRAVYDTGAGVMTSFTDFNTNSTRFQYDSFWRLVGIVKPGDSPEFPTASFEYRPSDLFRGLLYDYDAEGILTLGHSAQRNLVNAVTTHQRESAGQSGTFDSISLTDGAGHKLGNLHENDVAGQWVAKDFKRFSSRGDERESFLPFITSSAEYQVPTEAQTHVTSFYDAASRVVRTVNPPETTNVNATVTQTKTVFLPLETHLFDEEDVNADSPYFNTPHIQLTDGLGRLIGVIEVTRLLDDGTPTNKLTNWLTSYEYDLNDNLTHITDSQGNQKWFRYDGLKRKLFMNDPDRGVMTYTYDDASNLGSTLDARAQAIRYTYDGVNRLLSEDYLDAPGLKPDVRYFYDAPVANVSVGDGSTATARNTKGMLAHVEDLSGEEHLSYDARGRVEYLIKRLADPVHGQFVSYRTAYAYDSLDRVHTLTYPDNDQVGYRYNARNLLTRITGGPAASIITNIIYRASGQITQIDYGNGVRTTYDYDPRLRLNSLLTTSTRLGPNSQLLNLNYEFDGVSNIKVIRDQRPGAAVPVGDKRRNTQIFQYDDLYRITRAQYIFALPGMGDAANGFITHRYDRIGNMLNQSSDIVHSDRGVSVTDLGTMNYGGAAGRNSRIGRATAEPGPHALSGISHQVTGLRSFPYDANGNMTAIDGLTNTWDYKDRLIRVEDTDMVARYTYDYTDRRVAKNVSWKTASTNNPTGAATTSVLYPDKYFEIRESDDPVKYVWNGSTRVARVTGSLTTRQRTQRLRVFAGRNLVSVAVTATNALRQLVAGASLPASLATAHRWNSGSMEWVSVTPLETLTAGTVLWLELLTNATLTVTGAYSEPTNQTLHAGANFVAGWGLQPLTLGEALPSTVAIWTYDTSGGKWVIRLPGDLPTNSELPTLLAPGGALFARPEVLSELIVPENALKVRYYHQDHLGSSSAITDADGALVSETSNYAFGFARSENLARRIREPYGFTQKERDAESGMNQFEARFYSSSLARFSRVDPIALTSRGVENPQRQNAYSYSINGPLVLVDPNGESATFVGAVAGAVIGGGVAWWRGENIANGVISGALGGAAAGLVLDTGGAAFAYYGAAAGLALNTSGTALAFYGAGAASTAVGSVVGGASQRYLNGQPTTFVDASLDAGRGATFGVVAGVAGRAVSTGLQKLSTITAANNVAVRQHYLKTLEGIPGKIDGSLPIREQALQAFQLRNAAKVEARAMMTDRQAAALLDKTDPIPTLQDIVRKVYDGGRGPVGDDMWRTILESSTRSRSSVNQALGVGN